MAATIKAKILAKLAPSDVAEFVDDLTNEEDLFEQSVWEIANLLPVKMLIGVAATTPVTSSPHALEINEKVLLVFRNDTSVSEGVGNLVQCSEIGVEDSYKALDPSSIHFATKRSPVFWVHKQAAEGKPEVSVAPASSYITVYTYKRQTVGSGAGELDYDTATWIDYIPDHAIEAIVLMTATKIQQQRVSYQSNDEEDAELFNIFNSNLQVLDKNLQESMALLRPGVGQPEAKR